MEYAALAKPLETRSAVAARATEKNFMVVIVE